MNVVDINQLDYVHTLKDEELVQEFHNGDIEALHTLLTKYEYFVHSKTRTYFLKGGDREDVFQEGMVGLYKAIRDFRKEKMNSFRCFADLCITRHIITAIKAENRQKHFYLNTALSLDTPVSSTEFESNLTLIDTISDPDIPKPEQVLLEQERMTEREGKIAEILTELERKVLVLYMEGRTYVEISEALHLSRKSVDNALQRIKKKI
ncbi:RNA polymerase sporulation sigma factor SigH [Priestia megaterium]|jgi:RNA polymerase sporulation-specific sigma factor|uniref:RNA polymerase sporulation sigma factor SigH n=1 Tax=Priestia megaterium TaxID=1404 RepID=UPI002A6A7256|nr:RNA polymerase sporulation sigma factor SigH [Priestia megaterium]MDY0943696.1 RNA polymerase sporulation sigma factor SigH [Priestia megaterium]